MDIFSAIESARTRTTTNYAYGPTPCLARNFVGTCMSFVHMDYQYVRPIFEISRKVKILTYSIKTGPRRVWPWLVLYEGVVVGIGANVYKKMLSEFGSKVEYITSGVDSLGLPEHFKLRSF